MTIASDDEWRNFCETMGMPDLVDDERFADITSRHKNHDELDSIISTWTKDKNARDAMESLQRAGVAATSVLTGEGIFNDEHYQERGLLEFVDHPSSGPYFLPGIAWKMSKTPGVVRWPSPQLGEHNDFVFGELLGMPPEQIEGLKAKGVSGSAPDGVE